MNNELKTKEFLKKLESLKLSEASRARIQENLLEYARFHSVRVPEDSRSIEQVPHGTSLLTKLINFKPMTALLITIALIAGGGTSFAAEGAVPGDLLYPVKVEVNENIKGAFAFSNEAEARLQAKLAGERLKEAETLAARGELDANAAAQIATRLRAHYEEAEERSEAEESKGHYELSATIRASLEGTLRTYADTISTLNIRVGGNNSSVLIDDINAYVDASARAQATATADVSLTTASEIESTIVRADALILTTKTELARAESKISATAYARAGAKLDEAVSAQADAKASLRVEAYQAAYASVQAAIRLASEVMAMVQSALRLEVDITVDTNRVIDGVLDVRTSTNSQTETDTTEGEDLETTTNSERAPGASIDTGIDADAETNIDTDVIDVDVKSDSSVRSGLSL